MLKVTAQGIDELNKILEQMQCSGCDEEHQHAESACESHCGCGCEGHSGIDSACEIGDIALRLVMMGDHGFGLIPDIFREGDQAIEHNGARVLLIDPVIAKSVKGMTLDCVDIPGGRALTFIPVES